MPGGAPANAYADPAFLAVTRPGSPFEIGMRGNLRQFVNAPDDLDMMIDAARRFGTRTCVVDLSDPTGERRFSFSEIFGMRDRLVPRLQIDRGQRVAICMRNSAEWMVAFLAVMKAGGVAVLVNSRAAGPELLAMIMDTDPAVVLADAASAAALQTEGYAGRLLDVASAQDGEAVPLQALSDRAAPDDPCAILFTSGTTGRVKGAVLSHRNLITGLMGTQLAGMMVIHNMAREMGMPVEALLERMPQQASLLVAPLFHVSGLGSAFLSPFMAGSKVVIMRRWDPAEAARLIAGEGVSMLSAVPTMLWDMVHSARREALDLSSLRNIGCGGQALLVNLVEAIRAMCPQAQIGTGYGMTECAGAVAQALGEDFLRRPGSAGRVLPLVDMRIEGPDGDVLPAGEAGEIVVRGAQVIAGYWNRAEETAAAISADGWLRTGDIGMVDRDGYVTIVDRKKDMVISGGENIYCAEVERVMGEMPEVEECAAFGVPDERLGERLVAVVLAEGISEAAIIERTAQRLARYKAPARVMFSAEPLPRNAIGKVDKLALRKAWPQISGEH
ncbi:MAG: AMP-binding protein [Sphingomonadales bacterium]|nr:AMP-binding protein [Sphingomonadales bacterium]